MNLKYNYDKAFQEFINFAMIIELSKKEMYMISSLQPTLQLNQVVHKSKGQTDNYLRWIKSWDDKNCTVVIGWNGRIQ